MWDAAAAAQGVATAAAGVATAPAGVAAAAAEGRRAHYQCPFTGYKSCTCIYGSAALPPQQPAEEAVAARAAAWRMLLSRPDPATEPVALMLPRLVRRDASSLGSPSPPPTTAAVHAAAAARLERAEAAARATAQRAASLAAMSGLQYRLPEGLMLGADAAALPQAVDMSQLERQVAAVHRAQEARQQAAASAAAAAHAAGGSMALPGVAPQATPLVVPIAALMAGRGQGGSAALAAATPEEPEGLLPAPEHTVSASGRPVRRTQSLDPSPGADSELLGQGTASLPLTSSRGGGGGSGGSGGRKRGSHDGKPPAKPSPRGGRAAGPHSKAAKSGAAGNKREQGPRVPSPRSGDLQQHPQHEGSAPDSSGRPAKRQQAAAGGQQEPAVQPHNGGLLEPMVIDSADSALPSPQLLGVGDAGLASSDAISQLLPLGGSGSQLLLPLGGSGLGGSSLRLSGFRGSEAFLVDTSAASPPPMLPSIHLESPALPLAAQQQAGKQQGEPQLQQGQQQQTEHDPDAEQQQGQQQVEQKQQQQQAQPSPDTKQQQQQGQQQVEQQQQQTQPSPDTDQQQQGQQQMEQQQQQTQPSPDAEQQQQAQPSPDAELQQGQQQPTLQPTLLQQEQQAEPSPSTEQQHEELQQAELTPAVEQQAEPRPDPEEQSQQAPPQQPAQEQQQQGQPLEALRTVLPADDQEEPAELLEPQLAELVSSLLPQLAPPLEQQERLAAVLAPVQPEQQQQAVTSEQQSAQQEQPEQLSGGVVLSVCDAVPPATASVTAPAWVPTDLPPAAAPVAAPAWVSVNLPPALAAAVSAPAWVPANLSPALADAASAPPPGCQLVPMQRLLGLGEEAVGRRVTVFTVASGGWQPAHVRECSLRHGLMQVQVNEQQGMMLAAQEEGSTFLLATPL